MQPMPPIAPRIGPIRPPPQLSAKPPSQQHQQQQQQHPFQQQQNPQRGTLQQPPQPQHQSQFQEQTLRAGQGNVQASSQGHASTSDQSIQVLRDPMASSPAHYAPAEVMPSTSTSSPTEPHHQDQMSLHDSGNISGDNATDGRKGYGKRELSTSKRAAQNRAAQRAFRQRKEGYIKKLEEQVREYAVLSENFKTIQQENYQLRDYIIALQSRLLEAQGEVPPPPGGLDGLQPGSKQGHASQQGPSSQHQQHQLPQHQQQHQHLQGAATLPRLSELGASSVTGVQPPQPGPPQPIQPQAYDTKMTSAQAALQGPSILHSPSGGPR